MTDRPGSGDVVQPGELVPLQVGATGIGSWPGEVPLEAARAIFGELGGPPGLPYLPELPARGPGADMIGRTAAMLVDLPVDLQPSGWRFVDRAGRDQERAIAWRTADLDALAEAADGYTGGLKLQVSGPWTLASAVNLHRGERTIADRGARTDVVDSLAEGVARHVQDVQRLVPGARLVLQLDEPGLPAVLAGELTTQSGFGRLRAVEASEVESGIRRVLDAARAGGAVLTAVHCCAALPPVSLLRGAKTDAISVDATLLGARGWESVAVAVEAGVALWAGVLPAVLSATPLPGVPELVERLRTPWQRVGLPVTGLDRVAVTPTCGLAGASLEHAVVVSGLGMRTALALTEVAGS